MTSYLTYIYIYIYIYTHTHIHTAEIYYNIMKGNEYFVSL